jgi:hypothetical protein
MTFLPHFTAPALIAVCCVTSGTSAFGQHKNVALHSLAYKHIRNQIHPPSVPLLHVTATTSLHAKKSKKGRGGKGGGGGFGSNTSTVSKSSTITTISADKDSLEKQWDCFASITDLEIRPVLDEDDPSYRKFEVADVFVRVGSGTTSSVHGDDVDAKPATGWYRVGKIVAADDIEMDAALSLQRGLVFWTAAHMWPELVAKGGKKGAQLLELGHTGATLYMASSSDATLDQEEAEEVKIVQRTPSESLKGISPKNIGFRPDFNPPGFTYKRREKAAMKKKKSNMEEIMETGVVQE